MPKPMMSARPWSCALATLALLPAATLAGTDVLPGFSADFRTDPLAGRWTTFYHWPLRQARATWQAPADDGDAGTLVLAQGGVRGPASDAEANRFYEFTIEYEAAKPVLAGAESLDAQGQPMLADYYTALPATQDWSQYTFMFRSERGAASVRPCIYTNTATMQVRRVSIAPAEPKSVEDWLTTLHADVPPVHFDPPADRWERLPRTREKLLHGGTLRIVMLGDSIVNDTANSFFDLDLHERYPRTAIEVIKSVRGVTGCQYYQKRGRVRSLVVDHEPDLVCIGGISHGFDAEAVQNVVRQIRAGCDADIVVMSGAMRKPEPVERLPGYLAALAEVAGQERVAYLNLRQAWEDYAAHCGIEPARFYRDVTHANDLGRAALGRMMVAYLTLPDQASVENRETAEH